jgi:hypothetical protein
MKGGLVVVAVLAVIVLVIGGMLVGGYNSLVQSRTTVETAWAQVENQLQRRNDLIPNLVETVKGIAQQEQAVFGAIADARVAWPAPRRRKRRSTPRIRWTRRWAAVRGGRELPAAQIERELPACSERAEIVGAGGVNVATGHRKRTAIGADVPGGSLRAFTGLHAQAVLQRHARRRDAAARAVQFESAGYDEDEVAA